MAVTLTEETWALDRSNLMEVELPVAVEEREHSAVLVLSQVGPLPASQEVEDIPGQGME